MDLIHLMYFVEVAHYKSFTKASQNLHISQPSISKGIKNLEEKWNVRLFHRHGKTIELTEVGEAILPKIEEILDRYRRLHQEVSDPELLRTGKLRVGLPPLIGTFYLTEFLRDFHKEFPKIEMELIERPSGEIEQLLEDGSIHCGFCVIPTIYGKHETLLLGEEKLRVFMDKDHPLSVKRNVYAVELEEYDMVLYDNDYSIYRLIVQEFQSKQVRPQVILQSSAWEFLLGMVAAGVGVTIMPARLEKYIPRKYDNLVSRPIINPEMTWSPGLIWSEKSYASSPAEIFVNYVRQYFNDILVEK